ncbi:MAG: response regulator [Cyanobacteria bacterium P01_H01_bin.105]
MHEHFEVIPFLREAIESHPTGRVHIVNDDVEWCLDIADGKLLFAAHSLQYIHVLETTLSSLGYEALLPVYWRLIQLKAYKRKISDVGLDSLNWTSTIVGSLVQYNLLEVEQAERILAKLAEDAVDSLLGLEKATVVWYPFPQNLWHTTTQGTEVNVFIDYLSERLKAWQPLCDRICSPHQRPYCESLDDLVKLSLKGGLSQQMLESLVRLMQGASIRQLAQTIKQDETKLAQLLYPYIRHRAIKLWPPLPPLDRLPWLPTAAAQTEPASVTVRETSDALTVANQFSDPAAANNRITYANGSTSTEAISTKNGVSIPKSKYLIICIDDSKAMLEKIESYLDPEHFELKTIMDPIKAISKICTRKPSLVLMDISMPSISGNSLCSILKRSYMYKNVPIIMISSNTGALNKAKAEVSGAAGYLEKPFSRAQLMALLNTHLTLNIDGVK